MASRAHIQTRYIRMLHVVISLFLLSYTAAVHNVPEFSWDNRPQLIAFTFEGFLNHSSDATSLLSQFSNGPLACSKNVSATWFAKDCSSDMQNLKSNGIEIAAYNSSDHTNVACLRATATVKGARTGNNDSSAFEYTLLDTTAYGWPYADSSCNRIPFVNPDAVALMAAVVDSYSGSRVPIVVSLSNIVESVGITVTKLLLEEILALKEIVATTTGQLSQLAQAKSASEAESIISICRAQTNATNSSSSRGQSSANFVLRPGSTNQIAASTTLQTTPPATTSLATTTPTASTNNSLSPTSVSSRVGGSNASAGSASTTSPSPTTQSPAATNATANSTATTVGQVPENTLTDAPVGSTKNSSSSSTSTSTGYVPYVIGIGGGLCAMAVAIVYKVFKSEDRFPPVVTNGYVFETEDREIYDLEACNSSVRAASESPETSSYVHSDLDSVSIKS